MKIREKKEIMFNGFSMLENSIDMVLFFVKATSLNKQQPSYIIKLRISKTKFLFVGLF